MGKFLKIPPSDALGNGYGEFTRYVMKAVVNEVENVSYHMMETSGGKALVGELPLNKVPICHKK